MEMWLLLSLVVAAAGLVFGVVQTFRVKSAAQNLDFMRKDADEWKLRYAASEQSLVIAKARQEELSLRCVRQESEIQHQKASFDERLRTFQDAEQRLSQAFQTLSNDVLRQNSESFLQLANGAFKQHQYQAQGELDLRRQAVDQLIDPIHKSLGKVEERIQDLEKQRVGAYHGLQDQIGLLLDAQKKLQLEASNLAMALRSPTTRGRWGELQLRRVVEMAGMLPYCDFEEQTGLQGDGRLRPDMIIRLPGNKFIVIDAKVPLQSYLEAVDCADEDKRREYYRQHAAQVKKQVQSLGQKAYWEQLENSPEFVLLFLPGESFFSAALQADPSLIEVGADHRVLIATPTILIALLRTAAHAWRQEDVARNAQEISRLGKELYARISDLSGHLVDMGRSLGVSLGAYNKLVGTLESRVFVSARRFQDLKADDPKKEIKEAPLLDQQPRAVQGASSQLD